MNFTPEYEIDNIIFGILAISFVEAFNFWIEDFVDSNPFNSFTRVEPKY